MRISGSSNKIESYLKLFPVWLDWVTNVCDHTTFILKTTNQPITIESYEIHSRDFIFDMHIPLIMSFLMTPMSMTLWHWPFWLCFRGWQCLVLFMINDFLFHSRRVLVLQNEFQMFYLDREWRSIIVYRDQMLSSMLQFLVRRDESPENYCHSPGVVVVVVVVVGVVVRRQKL